MKSKDTPWMKSNPSKHTPAKQDFIAKAISSTIGGFHPSKTDLIACSPLRITRIFSIRGGVLELLYLNLDIDFFISRANEALIVTVTVYIGFSGQGTERQTVEGAAGWFFFSPIKASARKF